MLSFIPLSDKDEDTMYSTVCFVQARVQQLLSFIHCHLVFVDDISKNQHQMYLYPL
jgi:hypothetical protein